METENISSNPFQYNHFNSLYSELINHYYKEQPNQEILDSISTDDIRIKTDEELISEACEKYQNSTLDEINQLSKEEIFGETTIVDKTPKTELTKKLDIVSKQKIYLRKEGNNLLKEPQTFLFSSPPELNDSIITIKVYDVTKQYIDTIIKCKTSNVISELKRIIPCPHDPKHVSSEFIFMRNTFFTTLNDQPTIDRNLVYWREHRQFQYSRFPEHFVSTVSDEQLGNVGLKIDELYLFGHLSNCEHIFFISDIRLVEKEDLNKVFPMIVYRKRKDTMKCLLCENRIAKYEISGDVMSMCDPCYYCDECFHLLHDENDEGFEKRVIEDQY